MIGKNIYSWIIIQIIKLEEEATGSYKEQVDMLE